jgi:GNAT superfamily N-acetyltransferase
MKRGAVRGLSDAIPAPSRGQTRRFRRVREIAVRRADPTDLLRLVDVWRSFAGEADNGDTRTRRNEDGVAEIEAILRHGVASVAEADGSIVGFALADIAGEPARVTALFVAPDERRNGLAARLTRAVVEAARQGGAQTVAISIAAENATAKSVLQHWGLREREVVLEAPLDRLLERLKDTTHAVSFASIHVQTDDVGWVERSAAQFAPRVGSPGGRVEGPRNGWTTVYDPIVDGDPNVLLRYSRELSDRMGAVVIALSLELDQVVRLIALDRGGIVDEYLSVPQFYGQLPPGDVIGFAANPAVLHRLTGADPSLVRAVARTAASPVELPPARELLAAIADALGIEGAGYGFAQPA